MRRRVGLDIEISFHGGGSAAAGMVRAGACFPGVWIAMSVKSHLGHQPVLPSERDTSPPIPTEPAWTVWCLRGVHRWSQAELAARSGVPESAISRYENGKQTPSPKTWTKLCAAVGLPRVTVDEVLRPAIRKALTILGGTVPRTIGNSSTEAEDWTDELLRALSAILRPTIALVVEEALAQGSGTLEVGSLAVAGRPPGSSRSVGGAPG